MRRMSAADAVEEAGTRRARQAAATRQRLIDAGAELFAQRGYAASSVAAIGEVAGVSRGLLNFHFARKENLLRAVLEDLVGELEDQMFAEPTVGSPLVALAGLIDAHRRFLVEQPDRARLLFRLQAEALDPSLGLTAFAELHARWLDRTRAWWEQGIADGLIDPALDHNAVTTFTIGALRGIALEWLLAGDAVDIDASYAQLVRSVQLGIAPSA